MMTGMIAVCPIMTEASVIIKIKDRRHTNIMTAATAAAFPLPLRSLFKVRDR
jgi:hypothetical protein